MHGLWNILVGCSVVLDGVLLGLTDPEPGNRENFKSEVEVLKPSLMHLNI